MTSEALKRFRQRAKERQGGERDNAIFPFWNIPYDGSATLRFIPFEDGLTKNFWTEKKIIKMNFVDPKDESKLVRFEAPCYEMFAQDHKCPILGPVRDLYDEAKELENAGDTQEADRIKKVAGQHWIKPVFYYQGFVIKPGMNEEEVPENPIRIFPFLKQIHQVIFGKLMSEEEDGFDRLPTGEFTMDDVNRLLTDDIPENEIEQVLNRFEGINFILKKIEKGKYANYQTSSWAMQPTALDEEQIEALAKYGLHDLRSRLPKQPTDEQYDLMTEMVQVSIDRLQGTDDGYWNHEWEEAGLQPKRDRAQSGGDGDKPAGSTKRGSTSGSKIRDQLAKNSGKEEKAETPKTGSKAVSSILEKAKKNRGAKAATEKAKETVETPDADSTAKAKPTRSALASRIKSGLKKNHAEA